MRVVSCSEYRLRETWGWYFTSSLLNRKNPLLHNQMGYNAIFNVVFIVKS